MFPANLHYKTHLLVALQLRLKRKYNVARCTLYGAHPPQLFKAKNSAFIRFSISSDRFFEKSSKNERSRENSSDPFDGINLKKNRWTCMIIWTDSGRPSATTYPRYLPRMSSIYRGDIEKSIFDGAYRRVRRLHKSSGNRACKPRSPKYPPFFVFSHRETHAAVIRSDRSCQRDDPVHNLGIFRSLLPHHRGPQNVDEAA